MHVEDGGRGLRQLPQQQHARQAQVLLPGRCQPLDAALDLQEGAWGCMAAVCCLGAGCCSSGMCCNSSSWWLAATLRCHARERQHEAFSVRTHYKQAAAVPHPHRPAAAAPPQPPTCSSTMSAMSGPPVLTRRPSVAAAACIVCTSVLAWNASMSTRTRSDRRAALWQNTWQRQGGSGRRQQKR